MSGVFDDDWGLWRKREESRGLGLERYRFRTMKGNREVSRRERRGRKKEYLLEQERLH